MQIDHKRTSNLNTLSLSVQYKKCEKLQGFGYFLSAVVKVQQKLSFSFILGGYKC